MDYEKEYKEALEKARQLCAYPTSKPFISDLQDIFPELKESEDERIRKAMIKGLSSCGTKYWGGFEIKAAIAWLEKQGKNNMGISETTKQEVKDNLNKALEQETPESWNGFLGEHKLAWSKVDEEIIGNIRRIIAQDAFYNDAVDVNGELCEKMYIDADNWLKSLKERILPQPKQEWSEEDKSNLLNVKCIIDEIWHSQYIRGEINRSCEELESLWKWLDNIWQRVKYPCSTWKPSDEQINTLFKYAEQNNKDGSILTSLYQELKKVRYGNNEV